VEGAGTHKSQWITNEKKVNMRNVICSIQQRDRVPDVIDVQPINEWAKLAEVTRTAALMAWVCGTTSELFWKLNKKRCRNRENHHANAYSDRD
jgi:hypothetical protein